MKMWGVLVIIKVEWKEDAKEVSEELGGRGQTNAKKNLSSQYQGRTGGDQASSDAKAAWVRGTLTTGPLSRP